MAGYKESLEVYAVSDVATGRVLAYFCTEDEAETYQQFRATKHFWNKAVLFAFYCGFAVGAFACAVITYMVLK